MERLPRDAEDFWRDLFEVWNHGCRAFEKPFAPVMTPAEGFAGILHMRDRMLHGDYTLPLRVFTGGFEIVSDLPSYIPREDDGALTPYLERLTREHEGRRLGIMVKNFQAAVPPFWEKVSSFLQVLHDRFPRKSWHYVDFFLGNYERTFFGLHKDDVDVITFVVEGHKKFLVWPFDVIAKAEGLPDALRHVQYSLPPEVLERHYASATILEGTAGDVFYWPASFWHIAESTGAPVATLSLALTHGGENRSSAAACLIRSVMHALSMADLGHAELTREGEQDVREVVRRSMDLFRSPATIDAIARASAGALMREATLHGFSVAPDAKPLEDLPPATRFRRAPIGPIWTVVGARLIAAANGRDCEGPAAPALLAALAAVNGGGAAELGALLEGCAPAERDDALAFVKALVSIRAWRAESPA